MKNKHLGQTGARLTEVTCNGQSGYALQLSLLLCGHCTGDLRLAVMMSGGDLEEFVANAIFNAAKGYLANGFDPDADIDLDDLFKDLE